jgi:hypothetical protein
MSQITKPILEEPRKEVARGRILKSLSEAHTMLLSRRTNLL